MLYSNRGLDVRMEPVVLQFEILKLELKNRFYRWIEFHRWQSERLTSQLKSSLLEMVCIQMKVTEGMYKFTRLETRDMSGHHKQQSI